MDTNETSNRRALNLTLDRSGIRHLLAVAEQYDIDRGGLYDARSGCVNIWCSPEDKPACWNVEVTTGALNYARDYVGELTWAWRDEKTKEADLFIEATPFDLLDASRKAGRGKDLSDAVWAEILGWLEVKARHLLERAQAAPRLTRSTPSPRNGFAP